MVVEEGGDGEEGREVDGATVGMVAQPIFFIFVKG